MLVYSSKAAGSRDSVTSKVIERTAETGRVLVRIQSFPHFSFLFNMKHVFRLLILLVLTSCHTAKHYTPHDRKAEREFRAKWNRESPNPR